MSVLGSTKPGGPVQVVVKPPVPPERFRVIAPSERPEQDTLVTDPFEIIVSGSTTAKEVSLLQAKLSVTETV